MRSRYSSNRSLYRNRVLRTKLSHGSIELAANNLAPRCWHSILSHATCLSALLARPNAQSGEATRCTIEPMTNRAVSRSGRVLHSVDGYYSRFHTTRQTQPKYGHYALPQDCPSPPRPGTVNSVKRLVMHRRKTTSSSWPPSLRPLLSACATTMPLCELGSNWSGALARSGERLTASRW